MKYGFFILLFVCLSLLSLGQKWSMLEMIDIERYTIALDLSNFTKEISGNAHIEFVVKKPDNTIIFELVSAKEGEKTGMTVVDVEMGEAITWTHKENKITIHKDKEFEARRKYVITIRYKGVPKDGLIISKNKHRNHTAFGDNWPNRAHHWFPCTDHPSDKAIIEWKVNYPSNLALVANGKLIADSNVSNKIKYNHWQSTVPLPTKVMVVGLADFAVSDPCMVGDVEVTSWVFKQQKEDGFKDYAIACDVLKWFEAKVGEYPYHKLANVQSKTRYGGMENASCIFYFEGSVNGKGEVEDLIAHEIAHQWFGNSATESNWEHLWLSEGFATYMTDLYLQDKYGNDVVKERLAGERTKAINFYKIYQAPVVDSLQADLNKLLNPNSYQKGAWFLHMLRNEIGDSIFWESIRAYYQLYQLGNASTNDFAAVIKVVSGKDYTWFFEQWLKTEGHPNLEITYKLKGNDKIEVVVTQTQEKNFSFTLPLFINCSPIGTLHNQAINKKKTKFTIDLPGTFEGIMADPNVKLFFEYKILEN